MKKISLLILLLIAQQAFSQNSFKADTWKSIPKGVQTITVNNVDFDTVINHLLDKGYELKQYDAELGIITTEPRPLPRSGSYYLKLRVKNNRAEISGMFNTNVSVEVYGVRSEAEYWEIEKRGGRNSAFGQAFFQMHQAAESLGEISY